MPVKWNMGVPVQVLHLINATKCMYTCTLILGYTAIISLREFAFIYKLYIYIYILCLVD